MVLWTRDRAIDRTFGPRRHALDQAMARFTRDRAIDRTFGPRGRCLDQPMALCTSASRDRSTTKEQISSRGDHWSAMRSRPPRTKAQRQAEEIVRHSRRTVADDLRTARLDAGLSLRRLALIAGVSAGTVRGLEIDRAGPGLRVIARLAAALGMSLSVRLYPGTGPLIRDHLQAAMVRALLGILDDHWRTRLEVPVYRPVRGVIDVVLDDSTDGPIVACEAHSELRRLEQQLRWSRSKADALRLARAGLPDGSSGSVETSRPVSRLLLLRSTARNRASVTEYADLVAAAYPARTADAFAALTRDSPWPGDALLWCRVEDGQATILDRPPRGITVGR
jgi:transcriptional regulator with XRE-family HTH domain